jgi:tRNA-dihydrouridine synthase B
MEPKIYLAPMSGVTDLPFRLISREFGAGHCFFEMLHSNSIIYAHPKIKDLLRTIDKDRPISAQLLGKDPSKMLEAAQKIISLVNISSIDINSACPAKKIIRKGEGAAMLKNTPILCKIIKKLSSGLHLPVTVKLRTGFNKQNTKECVKTAKLCQENGASTIFIHGRTCSQGYSGDIDYKAIKAVKKAVKIPVFGSGNIFNISMAEKMLTETGCDGILVARGALGNPWIFKEIEQYLKSGKIPKEQTLLTKIKTLKKHLAYMKKYLPTTKFHTIGIMGKVAVWYLKGFPNAAQIRNNVFKTKSYKELIRLIDNIVK